MTVEMLNESGANADEAGLADLARFVLDSLRIHPLAELSVILVDEGAMERLHVQWMDEPGPTDVLSFPMDELRPTPDGKDPAPGLLGDVVLCPAVAERQGRTAGHGTEAELELLTTHGILHLLGYDHAEPAQEREMFTLQDRLLADWRARPSGDAPGASGST
jgi:probable rRNA maturation factor